MAHVTITRLSALAPVLLAGIAGADTLETRIGANYWNFDVNGTVRYLSTDPADNIDVNDELGYRDDALVSIYAIFEHPAPLIPNARVTGTRIDSDANGTLSRNLSWGNVDFTIDEDVTSAVQLDQVDLALYWRLLDNTLNLDVGLDIRYLDLDATITGTVSGTDTATASGVLPMLYAGAGIDLPLTGLGVSADGTFIGYSGNTLYDFTVRASYDSNWPIGIEAGYRIMKLDLDDFDDYYADISFGGPYAGLNLHF